MIHVTLCHNFILCWWRLESGTFGLNHINLLKVGFEKVYSKLETKRGFTSPTKLGSGCRVRVGVDVRVRDRDRDTIVQGLRSG